MQKKHLLTLALFFTANFLFAQRPYYNERPEFLKANSVWAFGKEIGFDFRSRQPLDTKIANVEGSASIADRNTGELLFYSDGRKIWNANHEVMPNGDSLLGNGNGTNSGSTTQGVCIVPAVNDPDKYYLFSLYGPTNDNFRDYNKGSLYYSVIDMKLNNGLGDIIPGAKNIILSKDTLSEAMIAVPGDNCDIWLIVHDYLNPVYKAYNISQNGISLNPVISIVGGKMPGFSVLSQIGNIGCHEQGGMSVSPNRKLIALCNRSFSINLMFSALNIDLKGAVVTTQLAQFDPSTGAISNPILIGEPFSYGYTSAFSPDNSKLYFIGHDKKQYGLLQYDISNYDSLAIANSKIVIEELDPKVGNLYSLKLYQDTVFISSPSSIGHRRKWLSSIDLPNLTGVSCGYKDSSIQLLSQDDNRDFYSTLPNDVVFTLPPDTFSIINLDTTICPNQCLVLKPYANHGDYIWDDASTSNTRTIYQSGTYWVMQNDGCHTYIDSFIVKLYDFPKPVINVNVLELGVLGSFRYDGYQWLLNESIIPGATQRTYTVHENGDYQVVVNNGYCMDTSDIYKVTNAGTSIADLDFLAGQVKVFPNPAKDVIYIASPVDVNVLVYSVEGKLIHMAERSNEIDIQSYAAGVYFLKVYDVKGRLVKSEKVVK